MKNTTTFNTLLSIILLAMLLAAPNLGAQETASNASDAELADSGVRRVTESVGMSDGVQLHTMIHLPPGEGPFPTLLLYTPYGTAQEVPRAQRFAEHGYAMVVQDVRGQGESEGDASPFIDEIPDLTATLEWVLAQPWSNGRVGLIGNSSQSYSAQLLASTGHPSLKALINLSGLTDPQEVFFPGGAFRLNTLYPWLQFFYLHRPIRSMDEWNERFATLPLSSKFEWTPGLPRQMAAGRVDTAGIEIPVLHVTGWNDVVYRQTLLLHGELAEQGVPQKLVLGPWMHNNLETGVTQFGDVEFGPEAAQDEDALFAHLIDWFDRWVPADGSGEAPAPAASVFMMGRNTWSEHDRWPPAAARSHTLYLTAPTGEGDGGLSGEPSSEASLSLDYDPMDPVPTWGGVNSHLFPGAGPLDQARFTERTDVLAFTTPPLEEALTLAGPQSAVLRVSSDAPDADFVAKLLIFQPDGYIRIVEDGIVRARHRDSFSSESWLEPGRPVEVTVDLGSTAIEVPAGHRIGLHVASSNFPKYDRNPSSKDDPMQAGRLLPATQTVHMGGTDGSRLVLTVLAEGVQ